MKEILLARRQVIGASAFALGGVLGLPSAARAAAANEPPLGWAKPPQAPASWKLRTAEGSESAIGELIGGRLTAVQLMFTGCGTTCPAQGLLFATMAARPRKQAVSWLSISIDALSDDAARLRAWQRRFGDVAPTWRAAVPQMRDVDALASYLRGFDARSGTHTNQVFVFDRQGRLAYRTGDDPAPEFLEKLLQAMA
jgi:protein SCO1/2